MLGAVGTLSTNAAAADEDLEAQIEMLRPVTSQPSYTHCNQNVQGPVYENRSPYKPTTPPPCSINRHGEIETLLGVEMMHHFVEANGVKFHFVTAGDQSNPAILIVHGLPESWYGFHHQIAHLSDEYHVIAIDLPGYGQSDKRLILDHSWPAYASYVGGLLDEINVADFFLVTHDRGSVLGENLTAVPGMESRIKRWVRMQQSANEPHGFPRPPHKAFADPDVGTRLFKAEGYIDYTYNSAKYVARPLNPSIMARIKFEWHYEGIAEAVVENFKTSNFQTEIDARMGTDGKPGLIETMTMPILFMQGEVDPGQKPAEYEETAEIFPNEANEVVILEGAAHFTASEQPEVVSAYIRSFFGGERL